MSINNSNFPVGTYLYRYFNVSKGNRVRAAISWWSNASCPDQNNCAYDRLDTDLHLSIFDPDGVLVTNSSSSQNNYELINFVAGKSGTYSIGVFKTRAAESSNFLGIAWVNDFTYLPDLRNKDGFVSTLFVRNDGAVVKSVEIHYFDQNGTPIIFSGYDHDSCTLNPNGFCSIAVNALSRIPPGALGSATVSGGEDVSVMVRQSNNSPLGYAAYTGVRQAAIAAHIPVLHKNNYSWSNTIFIRNASSTSASVTVSFKPSSAGSACTPSAYSIPAQGLTIIDLRTITCISTPNPDSPFIGSAWISSSQPIAVASSQNHYNAGGLIDSLMESEFVDSASTTAYAPLIQNYNYNWISGPAMQNASTNAQTLNVSFRNSSGSECDPDSYPSVAAHYSIMDAAPPGNPPCSSTASARILGAYSVEANINQLLPGTLMATNYPAVGAPGYAVVAPVWYKSWSSGVVILNTSDSNNATVQIQFYSYGGTLIYTMPSQVLSPLQQWTVQSFPGDTGFVGSAVVNSNVSVAVSSNHMPSSSGDGIMSIIGIHR